VIEHRFTVPSPSRDDVPLCLVVIHSCGGWCCFPSQTKRPPPSLRRLGCLACCSRDIEGRVPCRPSSRGASRAISTSPHSQRQARLFYLEHSTEAVYPPHPPPDETGVLGSGAYRPGDWGDVKRSLVCCFYWFSFFILVNGFLHEADVLATSLSGYPFILHWGILAVSEWAADTVSVRYPQSSNPIGRVSIAR
jgi:hypothetical protein